jgi:hypothetical protein
MSAFVFGGSGQRSALGLRFCEARLRCLEGEPLLRARVIPAQQVREGAAEAGVGLPRRAERASARSRRAGA